MQETEQEYRNRIDKTLEYYFNIDREVWSDDGKKRIDYVLQCKESKVLFGLEVKRKMIHKGSEIGKYLKQASNYSKLKFKSKFETSQIPIFISPAISDIYKEVKAKSYKYKNGVETFEPHHSSESKHSNINSLVGSFNVGEIRKFIFNGKKIFSFIFKNSEIWRSDCNYDNIRLKENNYTKMMQLIKK